MEETREGHVMTIINGNDEGSAEEADDAEMMMRGRTEQRGLPIRTQKGRCQNTKRKHANESRDTERATDTTATTLER